MRASPARRGGEGRGKADMKEGGIEKKKLELKIKMKKGGKGRVRRDCKH